MKILCKAPLCLFAGWLTLSAQAALAHQSGSGTPPTPPSSVTWFDLDVSDLDAARAFYGSLFGWTFTPGDVPGLEFVVIKSGDTEIGTLDLTTNAIAGGGMSIYFPVDDAAAAYAQALALGATSTFPAMPVPDGSGRMIAMVKDPDGHSIGFVALSAPAAAPAANPGSR
jgi:predicted enzyme related to lactoylglutathione lyase